MRRTARWLVTLSVGVLMWSPGATSADDHDKLPAGPIRDRHELMEAQGEQAEDINEALTADAEGEQTGVVQREAQAIALSAARIPSLFPKGSTDPTSRALPAIWENWDKFVQLSKQLQEQATALSNAAGSGTDEPLKDKAQKMFGTCKACHDQFRRPKEQGKGH